MEKRGPVASARTAVLAIIIIGFITVLSEAVLLVGLERFNGEAAMRLEVNRAQTLRVDQIVRDVQRLHDVPSNRRLAAEVRGEAHTLVRVTSHTAGANDWLIGELDGRVTAPWFAAEARYRDSVLFFTEKPADPQRLQTVLANYDRARMAVHRVVLARVELAREYSRRFVEALTVVLASSLLCCAAGWWFVYVPVERRERQALRRLHESRRRFKALFDYNPDAVFSLDRRGRIVDANNAAAALFSTRPESLEGERLSDYIFDDDGTDLTYALDRAVKGQASELDARVHTSDATSRDVIMTLCPIWVEDAVFGAYAIAKDVTAVRSAESALFRSERRFRSLFEQSTDGAVCVNVDGTFARINAAFERMTGYTGEELIGISPAKVVAPEDAAFVRGRIRTALETGEMQIAETVIMRKDGGRRIVVVKTIPIVEDGRIDGLYALLTDVTERRELELGAQEQARRIRELYLLAASSASEAKQIEHTINFGAQSLRMDSAQVLQEREDGSYHVHSALEGGIVQPGDTLARADIVAPHVTSSDMPLIIGDAGNSEWRDHPVSTRYGVRAFVGATIRVNGVPWGVLSFNSREGARPLRSTDADFVQLMAALIGTAIERGDRQHHLSKMAFYDALTGLPNRSLFAEHAGAALARARRDGSQVALHYVDVDAFKSVNDTLGHSAGDELLRMIARRFGATLRDSDVVARLSGDEFVYLQTGVNAPEDAMTLARRVVDAMDEPFLLNEGVARVSASVGISLFPQDGDDLESLLKKADEALYAVKAGGKRGARLYAGEGRSA